jgi:hypothetical protein
MDRQHGSELAGGVSIPSTNTKSTSSAPLLRNNLASCMRSTRSLPAVPCRQTTRGRSTITAGGGARVLFATAVASFCRSPSLATPSCLRCARSAKRSCSRSVSSVTPLSDADRCESEVASSKATSSSDMDGQRRGEPRRFRGIHGGGGFCRQCGRSNAWVGVDARERPSETVVTRLHAMLQLRRCCAVRSCRSTMVYRGSVRSNSTRHWSLVVTCMLGTANRTGPCWGRMTYRDG